MSKNAERRTPNAKRKTPNAKFNIDDDVLRAAKELARREGKTAGRIVSELARRGLTEAKYASSGKVAAKEVFLGFRPFVRRGTIITNEMIDRLREEEVD